MSGRERKEYCRTEKKEKAADQLPETEKDGTPGMIRTCDLLIRSQALYPAELRVQSEPIRYKLESEVSRNLLGEIALARAGDEVRVRDLDFDRTPFTVADEVRWLIFNGVERPQFGRHDRVQPAHLIKS